MTQKFSLTFHQHYPWYILIIDVCNFGGKYPLGIISCVKVWGSFSSENYKFQKVNEFKIIQWTNIWLPSWKNNHQETVLSRS